MGRSRLVAFAVMALSMPAAAAAQQNYRVWDRNNDGVITRAEWRGTVQEFRERDGNRDGVLSGNELRGSWQTDDVNGTSFGTLDRNNDGRLTRGEWNGDRSSFLRADQNGDNVISRYEFMSLDRDYIGEGSGFEALDVNNDGRIERREWRGAFGGFTRLDSNRDGVVSRREYAFGGNEVQGTTGSSFGDTIVVDSGQPWTSTAIQVNAGDVVTFQAQGTIQMSIGGDDRATPAGSLTGRAAAQSPRPDLPAGTLLVRIGRSVEAFGNGGTFTARTSGRLILGVNDDHFPDNSGQYRVRISVNQRYR